MSSGHKVFMACLRFSQGLKYKSDIGGFFKALVPKFIKILKVWIKKKLLPYLSHFPLVLQISFIYFKCKICKSLANLLIESEKTIKVFYNSFWLKSILLTNDVHRIFLSTNTAGYNFSESYVLRHAHHNVVQFELLLYRIIMYTYNDGSILVATIRNIAIFVALFHVFHKVVHILFFTWYTKYPDLFHHI